MKEDKQEQLFPKLEKSIEYDKLHEIGKKVSGGEVYPALNITIDEEARIELRSWPIEISSRRIIINKPFARFAKLEPQVILDAKKSDNIARVEFKMKNKNRVEMNLFLKNRKIKSSDLVLHKNGQIQHIL